MRRTTLILSTIALGACGDGPVEAGGDEVVRFSELRAEEVTSSRAVIRFTTSRPTSCEVEYGLANSRLDGRATDPSMVGEELLTTHAVPLEDLLAETTYFYRGFVVDSAGGEFRSAVESFTTLADSDPMLTNHALGATISDVSSNFGSGTNDSTWGANNAIDGKMDTEWATQGDGDGAYIVIDLGQPRTLTRLGVRSRKMTDGTSIVKSVELTIDGGAPLGPFVTPNPDEAYGFELDPSVTGQVIRVDAVTTTGGNTGLKEIELLGN